MISKREFVLGFVSQGILDGGPGLFNAEDAAKSPWRRRLPGKMDGDIREVVHAEFDGNPRIWRED